MTRATAFALHHTPTSRPESKDLLTCTDVERPRADERPMLTEMAQVRRGRDHTGSPKERDAGVKRVYAHTTRGTRARRYGGFAREAHEGLSAGCARFSEGANRLTIGEVQLCRMKQSHMRSQGFYCGASTPTQLNSSPRFRSFPGTAAQD